MVVTTRNGHVVALGVLLAAFALTCCAGETLYNSIVLPDVWPPQLTEVPKELATPAYLISPPAVIPIDVGRQLFVDDFLIEKTDLKRTYHQPEQYANNPVIRGRPYSDGVWYDPQDKTFKMWYQSRGTAYATSPDGIHWERPNLDVVPGTNTVQTGARDSSTVWLDLEEKDPARRYKMFRSNIVVYHFAQYWIHFSADGIHWGDTVVKTGEIGDRSTVFWNPFRKKWVMSIRGSWFEPRRRRYWEMDDVVTGPQWKTDAPLDKATATQGRHAPPWWIGADPLDLPRKDLMVTPQLYNMDSIAYESLILGFFTIWHGHPEYRQKYNEVKVGFTRDGWSWYRPDRRPFFAGSDQYGEWNYGNLQSVGGGVMVMGDRLYMYAGCNGTGLYTLRRDGFASMSAGPEGGALTTRPVRFGGKYLLVNVDAPQGELRVEALDEKGQPVAPFTSEKCRPLSVDKTLQAVTWEGAEDLSALSGKVVRFRFHLNNGRLYAFWVTPDKSGASYGYVAAGGPGIPGIADTVGIANYAAVLGSLGETLAPPAAGAAPTPAIWPAPGKYAGSATVELSVPSCNAVPRAEIRYTTDGSDPTPASLLYAARLTLRKTATLKARTFVEGMTASEVASAQFEIDPPLGPRADAIPPVRFVGLPVESFPAGTTSAAISLRTHEPAACRFAAAPGVAFDDMLNAFRADEDGRLHTAQVMGLQDGKVYTFYVKGRDVLGNTNKDDYEISVAVSESTKPAPFRLELEGESAKLTAPMAIGEDAAASGVKYVSSPTESAGLAAFTFSVPAAGDYVVWTRVLGPTSSNDSFFVSIDGHGEDVYDVFDALDLPEKWNLWHWRPVNSRDNRLRHIDRDPRVFPLEKGEHALVFRARESGTRLDRLIITNDRAFVPPPPAGGRRSDRPFHGLTGACPSADLSIASPTRRASMPFCGDTTGTRVFIDSKNAACSSLNILSRKQGIGSIRAPASAARYCSSRQVSKLKTSDPLSPKSSKTCRWGC